MRSAECCLPIAATGRGRQDRAIRARVGCSNTTSRRLHAALGQFGIPHSAFVPRTGPRPGGSTLGVPGWSAVDQTISLYFRIPHSAFRTPHSFPEQGLDLAAPRSEYPDGRPWIERLGNAECGMRSAECCLPIAATGRGRQRPRYVRGWDAPTRQAGDFTLPLGSSVFRTPHCAFAIRFPSRSQHHKHPRRVRTFSTKELQQNRSCNTVLQLISPLRPGSTITFCESS